MNAIAQPVQSLTAVTDNRGLEESGQYLTFMLTGQTYAFSILRIKEIIQYGQLTEVPRMPDFIRGVINLRGAVAPVIDLGSRFGKQRTPIGRRNCIIIIEAEIGEKTQHVGVMVDAVTAVLEIPSHEIEPAPSFGADIRADFIAGMSNINGKFVIILNIQHLLSMNDMAMLATATAVSASTAELAQA
jgi:purine-binding chemotaxis protein CheW